MGLTIPCLFCSTTAVGKVVKAKIDFEYETPGWFFLRNLLVFSTLWNLDYALEFSPDAEPATDHAALARLETH